jgi:hypothetical protein
LEFADQQSHPDGRERDSSRGALGRDASAERRRRRDASGRADDRHQRTDHRPELPLEPAGFLGSPPFNNSWNVNLHYRAALSYITGSHQAKIGFNNAWGHHENTAYSLAPYSYIFVGGQPNQIRQWATPYTTEIDVDADFGAFAQDRWTLGRATLTGGIRYDYFANSYPEQTLGPGTFAPTRNVTIPAVDNLSWHDITPRLGLAYDLFGNGKTAFKASLNKYLIGLGTFSFAPNNALTSSNNPDQPTGEQRHAAMDRREPRLRAAVRSGQPQRERRMRGHLESQLRTRSPRRRRPTTPTT